jgi:hypothetical protein
MGTTPEKCRESIGRLQEIMQHTTDEETRRKIAEVMRAWEDLCAELEGKFAPPSAQQAAE